MSKTKTTNSRNNSKKSERAIELTKENWNKFLSCAKELNKTPDFIVNEVLSNIPLIPVPGKAVK